MLNTIVYYLWNNFVINASQCHLIVSSYKDELMFATVGDALIWEEISAKLLRINIDLSLTFNDHVKVICKEASQKLRGIARLSNAMCEFKKKVLIRTFFESQFNYCPLIWMFCSRTLNHRINRLHERALRIAYDEYSSDFEELLEKDDTIPFTNTI